MHRASLLALALVLTPLLAPGQSREPEEIEFVPDRAANWGLRNIGAMITAPFMWNYWYKRGSVTIDTVPADAQLELFYIRANFQKLFMRAQPPVKLILPSRIMSTHRDALTVRVGASGYKSREFTYGVHKLPERLVLELKVLPNSLVFLGHTHFGTRTTLTLRTKSEPDVRVMRGQSRNGLLLALRETANKLDASSVSGGYIDLVEVSQVGEDVMIRVDTGEIRTEARSKQTYDPIRSEYLFTLDLMEKGARPPSSQQVRREVDAVRFDPEDPCSGAFERSLRETVDKEVVTRAHRPSGAITDLYRREAMMRVGRLDRGRVRTTSGDTLRTGDPLELAIALQSASEVDGYLALLGALAREQADPGTAMRSLIAPEMGAEEWEPIWSAAERARRACQV